MKRAVLACLTLQRRLSSSSCAAARVPPSTERTGLFGFIELQEPNDWDTFARSSIARQVQYRPLTSCTHHWCVNDNGGVLECRCNDLVAGVTSSVECGGKIRAVDDISDAVRASTTLQCIACTVTLQT